MIRWFCMFNSIGYKDGVWTAWIIYQRGREASWLETSSPNTRSMKHILKTILLCFQDFGVAKTTPKISGCYEIWKHQQKSSKRGSKFKQQKSCQEKQKKQQTTISHLFQVPRFLGLRGGRKARRGLLRFLRYALKVGNWKPHFPWGSNLEPSQKQTALKHVKSWSDFISLIQFQPSASQKVPRNDPLRCDRICRR